jgi:hypothetical protein
MKKIYSLLIAFGILLVLPGSTGNQDQHDTELSYKTGKSGPRYLKNFSKTPYHFPDDKSASLPDTDSLSKGIQSLFKESAMHLQKFEWAQRIETEHLFMYITDMGNMRFTLHIENGKVDISAGFDTSQAPTLVIPMSSMNVANLNQILSDGVLTYEEQYRIYYIITVPALHAIYKNDVLYRPGDKSMFRFDDFVHIEIPPAEEVLYHGKPVNIEATVVNVDGQWLVFRGLQGEADFKLKLTLDQATELYKLGFYEVRKLRSPKESVALSQKFLRYLNEVTESVRTDHLN